MNDVKLYDVYTLKDNNEYVVTAITKYDNKDYLLLSRVINNDELSDKDFKIVECYKNNGKNVIKNIRDSKLLLELGKLFAIEIENA